MHVRTRNIHTHPVWSTNDSSASVVTIKFANYNMQCAVTLHNCDSVLSTEYIHDVLNFHGCIGTGWCRRIDRGAKKQMNLNFTSFVHNKPLIQPHILYTSIWLLCLAAVIHISTAQPVCLEEQCTLAHVGIIGRPYYGGKHGRTVHLPVIWMGK